MWFKYTSFLISKYSDGTTDGVFSKHNILNVLHHAYESVKYNIPQSSLIWNQYRDFISLDLQNEDTSNKTKQKLDKLYLERLSIPHKTLSDTYTDYSTFVTSISNDNSEYEQKMSSSYKIYSKALKSLELRDKWEATISKENSVENYAAYIQWEITLEPKKFQSPELTMALYERAIKDYPNVPEIWDDYILYVSDNHFSAKNILSIVDRGLLACHCAGSLWAHKLRMLIIQNTEGDQLEELKNMFLSKRLMESAENYNNWKIFIVEWLQYYLRPEGKQSGISEENILIDCETAIERVKEQGFSDPDFKVEKIVYQIFKSFEYEGFTWRDLVKVHGNKADYWITRIDTEIEEKQSIESIRQTFEAALRRKNLDFPETILEKRVEFERKFGTSLNVQQALAFARIKSKIYQHKRMEAVPQERFLDFVPTEQDTGGGLHPVEIIDPGKLKRSYEDTEMEERESNEAGRPIEMSELLDQLPKKVSKQEHIVETGGRDRENNTVIVTNLSKSTTEPDIRHFFKDCGEILSLSLSEDHVASIEFAQHQDALSALTKSFKKLHDSEITVKLGEETTIWVTNFPPDYTEENIRDLFDQYGNIMSVRFPSLKFNTHRRFCYVQFSDSHSARKAVSELDGEIIGKFTLQVKISNPAKKSGRSGAMYEDREVFVKGLDFNKVDETELRNVLGECGEIERVRLPLSRGNEKAGRLHDGYGFVVFKNAADANTAIKVLDGKKLGSRNIKLTLSSNRATPAKTVSKIVMDAPLESEHDKNLSANISARTLNVSNLSDIVNDTQLRNIFEKYGPLKQITLQPKLNNAKVEYVDVADAGKAELALQGYEIGGQRIFIGASSAAKPKASEVRQPATVPFVPRSLLRRKKI